MTFIGVPCQSAWICGWQVREVFWGRLHKGRSSDSLTVSVKNKTVIAFTSVTVKEYAHFKQMSLGRSECVLMESFAFDRSFLLLHKTLLT